MFVLALLAFRNSLNEKKKMSETDNYYTCGTASLPQVKTVCQQLPAREQPLAQLLCSTGYINYCFYFVMNDEYEIS